MFLVTLIQAGLDMDVKKPNIISGESGAVVIMPNPTGSKNILFKDIIEAVHKRFPNTPSDQLVTRIEPTSITISKRE